MQQDAKESLETDPTPENFSEIESQEPTQTEVDRSHYFEGLTEAAIVYNPTGNNLF